MCRTIWILMTILLLSGKCVGQYSKEFHKIIEYKTCESLISTINKNWNKKKKYYKSNFTPLEKGTKKIMLPCINGIKSEDIRILFGNPSEAVSNYWIYYTSPPIREGFAETYLTIEFEFERVKIITETNCEGTFEFINKNWKYDKVQNYFITNFASATQGTKKIEIPCINNLERNVFQNIFGYPHFAFKSETLSPMQPIQWDDKGNKIKDKPYNNRIIICRYYTSKNVENEFNRTLMEVTFHPTNFNKQPYNRIEVKNCSNIIDTIKSKFSYNDSLGRYQYKGKLKFEFNQIIQLASSCFFGMDSSTTIQIFGKPSTINKKHEWEYRTGDRYQQDKYAGEGMKIFFSENGTINHMNYIYAQPFLDVGY